MSGEPVIVIVVTMEETTPRIATFAAASEEDRLCDWVTSQPGLANLIDAAVRLALPEPAEPAP